MKKTSVTEYGPVPRHCVVTGGSGFVGQRLCEMLLERGAERVVSFDIVPMPTESQLLHDKARGCFLSIEVAGF